MKNIQKTIKTILTCFKAEKKSCKKDLKIFLNHIFLTIL